MDFPRFCERMNSRLEKNGNKHHLAGDKTTIADIQLAILASDWFSAKNPHTQTLQAVVNKNHALKHFVEHHLEHTFKEYLEQRPETMI